MRNEASLKTGVGIGGLNNFSIDGEARAMSPCFFTLKAMHTMPTKDLGLVSKMFAGTAPTAHVFGTTPRIKKSGSAISHGLVASLQAVSSDLVAVPQSLKTCGCPEKGPEGFFSRKPQAKCPLSGPHANRPVLLRKGPEGFFWGSLKRNATFRS